MSDCIFLKRIERPDMCEVYSPVTEATYNGLKALVKRWRNVAVLKSQVGDH